MKWTAICHKPLNPKSTGLLQHWGGGCFAPLCKIRSRHARELKLIELIASIITNDVIMTSLPKQWQNLDLRETRQIIYHSKGIDKSYPKMYFLLNLSRCVKRYEHFLSDFDFFTISCSPNMVISRDPRCRF